MDDDAKRLLRAWLIMAGLTLAAIPVGHATTMRPLGAGLTLLLLGLAFVKSALLLHDYLDLRHAPRWNAGLRSGILVLLGIIVGLSLAAGLA
ncbi:MAG TPA: cytochrome C oxidase subunit IV family protein [Beijerinckiaceae bacterium]|nr:cytochrome C oxidase subunit IV family protein [Beijerinckiaceae bacterium]